MMKKRSTTSRLNKVDYAIFIIFSIAAALMLYLFYRDLNAFTIKQAEEPVAKIYFKRNTAQRKFSDNDIWEVLTNSSDIYDGDRIRTSKDSEAYTEFVDSGIQIQLREKSMVQIFKNKKQRSIDFIGGEIFVANNSPEEKVVIKSGKKEIAVSQASEVKLALPEVSAAAAAGEEEAEESPVVIEVISGQVEVIEQPAAKAKAEKMEPEPIIVSAGETVTLVPVVEKEPELSAEPVTEAAVTETSAAETTVEDKAGEKVEKDVEIKAVAVSEPVIQKNAELAKPVSPKVVEPGVEKAVKTLTARFKKSVYDPENNKYNYAYGFCLADAIGKNVTVPAGSVIEVTFKGIADNDILRFAMQISTGEEPWRRAHAFKNTMPDMGSGIKKGKPFEAKHKLVIDHPIVNSDKSWVDISYDPLVLDAPSVISDFNINVKVISNNGGLEKKNIAKGYKKTLEFKKIALIKDVWGSGPEDFDYRMTLDANEVFDEIVSIPAGTKIRISISGSCDQPIPWCYPEFIYTTDETWDRVLLDKDDFDVWEKLRFSDDNLKKNQKFDYSREFIFKQPLPDTNLGLFQFTPYHGSMTDVPVFSDFKIYFEVVE